MPGERGAGGCGVRADYLLEDEHHGDEARVAAADHVVPDLEAKRQHGWVHVLCCAGDGGAAEMRGEVAEEGDTFLGGGVRGGFCVCCCCCGGTGWA